MAIEYVSALLIGSGFGFLAVGGVYLGLAYATDDIQRRTKLTRHGSYVAAFGVLMFGWGLAMAVARIVDLLNLVLMKLPH